MARVHGGPGALLTGLTGLEALGLRGWERDEVQVLTVHRGTPVTRSPMPVRLHRVKDFSGVRRHHSLPVHIAPQAAVLAAGGLTSARSACGLLDATVQQRLASPGALAAVLEQSPRVRHRALLRHAVADIAAGAEALSEIDLVRLCRRYGLPAPVQQAVRRDGTGRRRYLDASWRRADGRLVVVEVDGALHLSPDRWWDDQARQNSIVLEEDAIVLRFPSVVVRTMPHVVAEQIAQALGIRVRIGRS